MVVSADQIDMNQGFGSSSMTITYITRRGTNSFNGRVYEGYRAEFLDAKNWGSSVKPKYHRNDFGGSAGGPILRDKLFFFASMSALDIPGGALRTQTFLSDNAKQGVFAYANGAKANLFNVFAAHNAANGTTFPASVSQINPMTERAHRRSGQLSAECRRPVRAGAAADRSESAHVGVGAPEFAADLLPDVPGGLQRVAELAGERVVSTRRSWIRPTPTLTTGPGMAAARRTPATM